MRTLCIVILSILLTLIQQATAYSPSLNLQNEDTTKLNQYIYFLEDKDKSLTPQQILHHSVRQKFKPFDTEIDSIGVTNSVWWFQFQLDFGAIQNQTRLLLLNNPLIYDARLYQVKQGQMVELYRSGFAFPASERAIFDAALIFPLKQQSGLSHYYLRVNNSGSLQVPLSIWKPEALSGKRNTHHWLLGIYYGIIISMAIYNLFIGWSTNIKAYFYYVGYLIALSLAMAFNDGYAQLLLFSDSPFIAYRGINWVSALVIIFASQFARDFLHSETNSPLSNKWLLINIFAAVLFLLIGPFLNSSTSANIILTLVLSFISSMFVVGISCWFKKVRAARYFVFSWIFMILGTLMMALTKLGMFPTMAIGEFGTHIGSAIEAMLLSFALAARIRWLEEQRASAEKRTRLALETSHKKLEESNRVKDEFFSLLSHELRTPMNGIRGVVDLFYQENLTKKQTHNLKLLNESTDEMLSHVDQLLVFSQLKSDHLKLNQRPFDLAEILSRLTAHCRLLCDEQKIKFTYHVPSKIEYPLIGDERVLFVILNQLLDSHIKKKGIEEIEFKINHEKCNEKTYGLKLIFDISSKINNQQPTTSKSANEEQLNTLKTDYIQPESSWANEGIIAKESSIANVESILNHKLVHLLHGKLTLNNDIKYSPVTSLELSFKQSLTSISQAEIKSDTHQLRGLVVDDNSINRIVASKYLEQLGYAVESASDGEEALQALNNLNFDFILMDCHMPVLNGFKTTEIIRQGQIAPEIPIIAVTADVTAESTQECYACGMNEVLHKPLGLDKLSATLRAQGLFSKMQHR